MQTLNWNVYVTIIWKQMLEIIPYYTLFYEATEFVWLAQHTDSNSAHLQVLATRREGNNMRPPHWKFESQLIGKVTTLLTRKQRVRLTKKKMEWHTSQTRNNKGFGTMITTSCKVDKRTFIRYICSYLYFINR